MIPIFNVESLSLLILSLIFIVGVALLTWGGDLLTRGSSDIAFLLKIPATIIGLTVVSMATSIPELFTSIIGTFQGIDDLVIGNIVGSNIGNLGLILGVAAIISPVLIQKRLIKWEVPFLLGVTIVFIFFAGDGVLARHEGIVLIATIVAYILVLVRNAIEGDPDMGLTKLDEVEIGPEKRQTVPFCIFYILIGTIMLGLGADIMIQSATVVAHRLDLSETIIGLTIVAIGTSLPELATSIVAAIRKESDLIAGNIIGSNLFNLLLVGGAASIVSPLNQEPMLIKFEYPVMLLLTGIVWLFYSTDKKVSRSEGIVLVLLYLLVISIIYLYRNGIL